MIDYGRLARSVNHYNACDYQAIEVPWTVTQAIGDITRPDGAKDFKIANKDKVLVASAEQGFLYLALKGFLPKGRFQAITPCFRDEPFDKTHSKYFMKNELIITDGAYHNDLLDMINCAKMFFESELVPGEITREQTGDVSYDLLYNGIELGSYGIRTTEFLTWIYGTGCAEPRMSMALQTMRP